MSKNRQGITCNGRPAFYASMYEDIRECALNVGWAVALHGSLKTDMDIMAMPWTKKAISFERLIQEIVKIFEENQLAGMYSISYGEKPHGRVVATVPIWEDFYLDISTIKFVRGEWIAEEKMYRSPFALNYRCSQCGEVNHKTNFCPNCGADMRKKVEK